MSYDALAFLEDLFRPNAGTKTTFESSPEIGIEHLDVDWRVWFEERAAIMEYEGGLHRERAEAEALADTLQAMQRQIALEQAKRQSEIMLDTGGRRG